MLCKHKLNVSDLPRTILQGLGIFLLMKSRFLLTLSYVFNTSPSIFPLFIEPLVRQQVFYRIIEPSFFHTSYYLVILTISAHMHGALNALFKMFSQGFLVFVPLFPSLNSLFNLVLSVMVFL